MADSEVAQDAKPSRTAINWKRAVAIVTVGANIGVLLGLILLVVELNQNQTMMRAQTRHEISQELVDILVARSMNPELVDIQIRAEQGETLTRAEEYQFIFFVQAMIRYWEDVHYQYRLGLYDEAEFTAQRETWVRLLRLNPLWMQNWCQSRIQASQEFVDEMNELLGPNACQAYTQPEGG